MAIKNYENPLSEQSEILMNSISIKYSLPSISYLKRRLFHTSIDMKYLYNGPLTRRFDFVWGKYNNWVRKKYGLKKQIKKKPDCFEMNFSLR